MLLRPVMLETKATCLLSGDHSLSPTNRVMYSLSTLSGWISSLLLAAICAGSVITAGLAACAKALPKLNNAKTNKGKILISLKIVSPAKQLREGQKIYRSYT